MIDKPAGMTSHDVVDRVRRSFKTRKVGHAGTLDPDATGVLIVGLGRATRLLAYAQAGPKRYRARARFGITTTTQDASGEVVEVRPAAFLSASDVRLALGSFTGEIEQVPPMVSAVKVGGERLYRKARRGEEVERAPRTVYVARFELTDLEHGARPEATFDIVCSAGTYVRTLIHDLGAALGCGAHLVALRRTEAGGFTEAEARPLGRLGPDDLRPLTDAVRELRVLELEADAAGAVRHGRALPASAALGADGLAPGEPVALVHGGELLAVYRVAGRTLRPDRVLASP